MDWKNAALILCLLVSVTTVTAQVPETASTQEISEPQEAVERADGRVKCADVTLERPYQGMCLTSNGDTMKVDVTRKSNADGRNRADAPGQQARETRADVAGQEFSETKESETERNEQTNEPKRPRGIFGGISNAADRAVSVVSSLFGGGERPGPDSENETDKRQKNDPDPLDDDVDGDGLLTSTETGEEYFVHATGLIDEIREDDTVSISIDAAHPDAVLQKGDRVALIGFASKKGNTGRFDSQFGLLEEYDSKAIIGKVDVDNNPGDDGSDDTGDEPRNPVTLTPEDVGKTLSEVWDGEFTAKTGDGSAVIGWTCKTGDFQATEYYGTNTVVTRTTTADAAHSPAPSPVSHVGYMDDTTSTVSAGTWQVSSEHEDREPPADCTATIETVQGNVEIMAYQEGGVNEKTHSVTLSEGEIQISAESRTEDGNAATYRLVAGDENGSMIAQVAYGTIHLTNLPEDETGMDAPEDRDAVMQVTVRDQEVTDTRQVPRDADVWNDAILEHADQLHEKK